MTPDKEYNEKGNHMVHEVPMILPGACGVAAMPIGRIRWDFFGGDPS